MASQTTHTWGPANIDSLLTTTKEVIAQSKEFLNDAIFSSIPLLDWLNSKARVTRQGGATILVPLLYGTNDTFAAYSGDDIIDTSGQEGMTMAQYDWKNYGGTIKVAGDEMRQNAGSGKLTDLLKAKTRQATMSARNTLATDLFAATQGSKNLNTLVTLIDATSTIADVNSTTNSWWQSEVNGGGAFDTQGLADFRIMRNELVVKGQNGAPMADLILTTSTVYNAYEATQVGNIRYGAINEANAGFGTLRFGNAEIRHDPNCTSGVAYFLSSEALEFAVHSEADWDIGDFIEPSSQDVKVAKILWMGNLITNNRRRLGKITSITAS